MLAVEEHAEVGEGDRDEEEEALAKAGRREERHCRQTYGQTR